MDPFAWSVTVVEILIKRKSRSADATVCCFGECHCDECLCPSRTPKNLPFVSKSMSSVPKPFGKGAGRGWFTKRLRVTFVRHEAATMRPFWVGCDSLVSKFPEKLKLMLLVISSLFSNLAES